MSRVRAIHRWLLTLLLVAVAVQFFLAGLGAFKAQHGTEQGTIGDSQFASYFSPHRANANVLMVIALLVLIAAVAGRMGKRWILVSLSLPILIELQYVFADNGPSWFRALHVLNALVIAAVAGAHTGIAWREARA
jgi:uncharacterized membrane protein YphA (DoxX/SURF4 family)